MRKQRQRDEWFEDIDARQRNVVFPDTANNEARFWRNIIGGKQHLTTVQKIGICVFGLAVVALVFGITFVGNKSLSQPWSWERFAGGALDWVIGFGILGFFLVIFRLSQHTNRK